MSTVQSLEPGSRHDLRVGISPDAPDEDKIKDEEGSFGYCHSYETSSRYDGPGLRIVIFVSGCLLRCTYCHNPDTWHLKDGTYVSLDQVLRRLGDFAPSIQALGETKRRRQVTAGNSAIRFWIRTFDVEKDEINFRQIGLVRTIAEET